MMKICSKTCYVETLLMFGKALLVGLLDSDVSASRLFVWPVSRFACFWASRLESFRVVTLLPFASFTSFCRFWPF